MQSNPLRRTRVAFAAALALVAVLAPGAARATDKCKIGASAVSDIRSLASLRVVIDDQCPCATFDGSSATTNRGAFLKCVKARIADASDGTALLGFSLRKQCKNTLQAIYKLSTCGYGDERVACCEVKPASGKKKASIKKPSSCEDSGSGSVLRTACAAPFTAEACSFDATNSCIPASIFAPEETVDLPTMIACYTIAGAYDNFEEATTGSIEVGKAADLVVLDRNLFATPKDEIARTKVLLTLLEGKEVYRDPGFVMGK